MDTTESTIQELEQRLQNAVPSCVHGGTCDINASLRRTCATLTGDVHTWAEREAAGRAALSIPGVRTVDNQLCLHVKGTVVKK